MSTEITLAFIGILFQTISFVVAGLLAFSNLKKDVALLQENGKDIKENFQEFRTDLKETNRNLAENSKDIATIKGLIDLGNFAKSSSPLNLTDEGLDLLESIGLTNYIDSHFTDLWQNMQIYSTRTPYDIQESAREVMFDLADTDILDKMKHAAYQKGTTLETITILGSIYLRNKALQSQGLSIDDVKV
jgi:hypothetical protein